MHPWVRRTSPPRTRLRPSVCPVLRQLLPPPPPAGPSWSVRLPACRGRLWSSPPPPADRRSAPPRSAGSRCLCCSGSPAGGYRGSNTRRYRTRELSAEASSRCCRRCCFHAGVGHRSLRRRWCTAPALCRGWWRGGRRGGRSVCRVALSSERWIWWAGADEGWTQSLSDPNCTAGPEAPSMRRTERGEETEGIVMFKDQSGVFKSVYYKFPARKILYKMYNSTTCLFWRNIFISVLFVQPFSQYLTSQSSFSEINV